MTDDEFDNFDMDLGEDEFFPLGDDDGGSSSLASSPMEYMANVGKSVGAGILAVTEQFLPAVGDIARELQVAGDETASDYENKFRTQREKLQKVIEGKRKGIDPKTIVADTRDAIGKELLDAVKSGDFRFQDLSGGFGGGDIDLGFDSDVEVVDNSSELKEIAMTTVAAAQSTNNTNMKLFEATSNQNVKMFNRETAVNQIQHSQSMGYIHSIDSNVKKMTHFFSTVGTKAFAAQMEYGTKDLEMTKVTMNLLKEIQKNTYVPPNEDVTSERGKLASIYGMGFDGSAWGEGVRNNITNMFENSAVGSMMGSMGMLMDDESGMAPSGSLGNRIIKGAMKKVPSMMISPEMQGKFDMLNERIETMPDMVNSKINEIARYSDNPILRMMGSSLGIKELTTKKVDLGVKNLDETANFDRRFYTTVTDVVPGLLSKILAATTGEGEMFYDMKSGTYKQSSHAVKEFEYAKTKAYEDSSIELSTVKGSMYGSIEASSAKDGKDPATVKADFDRILKNIINSQMHFNPNRALSNDGYRKVLVSGLTDETNLLGFIENFQSLPPKDQMMFASGIAKTRTNVAEFYNSDLKTMAKSGGGQYIAERAYEEELEDKKRNLNILDDSSNYAEGSREYMQSKRNLFDAQESFEMRYGGRIKSDIGDKSEAGVASGNGGRLTDIYELLMDGVNVFVQSGTNTKGANRLAGYNKSKHDAASADRLKADRDAGVLSDLTEARHIRQQEQYRNKLAENSLMSNVTDKFEPIRNFKSKFNDTLSAGVGGIENAMYKSIYGDSTTHGDGSSASDALLDEVRRASSGMLDGAIENFTTVSDNNDSQDEDLRRQFGDDIDIRTKLKVKANEFLSNLHDDVYGEEMQVSSSKRGGRYSTKSMGRTHNNTEDIIRKGAAAKKLRDARAAESEGGGFGDELRDYGKAGVETVGRFKGDATEKMQEMFSKTSDNISEASKVTTTSVEDLIQKMTENEDDTEDGKPATVTELFESYIDKFDHYTEEVLGYNERADKREAEADNLRKRNAIWKALTGKEVKTKNEKIAGFIGEKLGLVKKDDNGDIVKGDGLPQGIRDKIEGFASSTLTHGGKAVGDIRERLNMSRGDETNPLLLNRRRMREGGYGDHVRDALNEDRREDRDEMVDAVEGINNTLEKFTQGKSMRSILRKSGGFGDGEDDEDGEGIGGEIKGMLGGLATGVLALGTTALIANRFSRKGDLNEDTGLNETGSAGDKAAQVFGMNGGNTYGYDGRELSFDEQSANNTSIAKGKVQTVATIGKGVKNMFTKVGGGMQNIAGILSGGPNRIAATAANVAERVPGASRVMGAVDDVARVGVNAVDSTLGRAGRAISDAPGKLLTKADDLIVKVTQLVQKLISNPKVQQVLGPDIAEKLLKNMDVLISPRLIGEAGEGILKGAMKGLSKYLGPIGIALMVVDFFNGYNNAAKYFQLGAGGEATLGMKITAGLVNFISGLLFGIIPPGWLSRKIFDLIGNEDHKKWIANTDAYNTRKAEILGVPAGGGPLAEFEMRGSWTRAFDSDKSNAKLLGFGDDDEGVERFRHWHDTIYKPSKTKLNEYLSPERRSGFMNSYLSLFPGGGLMKDASGGISRGFIKLFGSGDMKDTQDGMDAFSEKPTDEAGRILQESLRSNYLDDISQIVEASGGAGTVPENYEEEYNAIGEDPAVTDANVSIPGDPDFAAGGDGDTIVDQVYDPSSTEYDVGSQVIDAGGPGALAAAGSMGMSSSTDDSRIEADDLTQGIGISSFNNRDVERTMRSPLSDDPQVNNMIDSSADQDSVANVVLNRDSAAPRRINDESTRNLAMLNIGERSSELINSPIADSMTGLANNIMTELDAMRAIHSEQIRHNTISEEFMVKLLKLTAINADNIKHGITGDIDRNELLAKSLLASIDKDFAKGISENAENYAEQQAVAREEAEARRLSAGTGGSTNLGTTPSRAGSTAPVSTGGRSSWQPTGGEPTAADASSIGGGYIPEGNLSLGYDLDDENDPNSVSDTDKLALIKEAIAAEEHNVLLPSGMDARRIQQKVMAAITGTGATHERVETAAYIYNGINLGRVEYYAPKIGADGKRSGDIYKMIRFEDGTIQYGVDNTALADSSTDVDTSRGEFGRSSNTVVATTNTPNNNTNNGGETRANMYIISNGGKQ